IKRDRRARPPGPELPPEEPSQAPPIEPNVVAPLAVPERYRTPATRRARAEVRRSQAHTGGTFDTSAPGRPGARADSWVRWRDADGVSTEHLELLRHGAGRHASALERAGARR